MDDVRFDGRRAARLFLGRVVSTVAAGVLLAAWLSGCSGGRSDEETAGTSEPTVGAIQAQPDAVQQPGEMVEPQDGVLEISISGAQFLQNQLKIRLGEAVTIRVLNQDDQTHNLRIAGLDGRYGTEDDAVTVPDAIAGGDSGELRFAPAVPGEYTFRCDFHPGTMGGRIIAQ